jgi:hypothetical protein
VRVNRATRERKSAFYGGLWGFLGDYGHLRNSTTNQKVAGSSPAERATKSPANGETRKQWETIAPILPRHYVTERGILYSRRDIDEWLMARTSPADV